MTHVCAMGSCGSKGDGGGGGKGRPSSEADMSGWDIHLETATKAAELDAINGQLRGLASYQKALDSDVCKQVISSPKPDAPLLLQAIEAYKANLEPLREIPKWVDKAAATSMPTAMHNLARCEPAGANNSGRRPEQFLVSVEAAARELAAILATGLRVEEFKCDRAGMCINDLSMYKRAKGQYCERTMKKSPPECPAYDELDLFLIKGAEYPVRDKFKAALIGVKRELESKGQEAAAVEATLAALANICYAMLAKKSVRSDEGQAECLRAMTFAIVLYDHVSQAGAFREGSPIEMAKIVKILISATAPEADFCRRALKYLAAHYDEPSTPQAIVQMLEE